MSEVLDGSLFGPDQPCFGCSPEHPAGFRLSFTREGDAIVTHFVPSERYQGPPTIMHGGLVFTLADELGAWAIIGLLGKFGFTAQMNGRLHRPARIGILIEGRARITKESRRIVDVEVSLTQENERIFSGELRFVLLDEKGAEKMLGGPLPEAWKRFSR